MDYFIPKNVQHAKIQITSVDGKVLATKNIYKLGKGAYKINAATYSTGNYFYSLFLDRQLVGTKKMLMNR